MKGVIFDMDGTLVDSMNYWENAFIKKMKDEHLTYPDDIFNIITPMGVKDCCKYICQLGCNKTPEEIYNEVESAMIAQYATNIPAKPFVIEYMQKLKAGGVKMCILSASTHKMIEASAKKCEYFDFLEFIISCEEMGMSKAEPEIFRLVAEKMGLSIEDVTVFDDNSIAVKSAKNAGAEVCAVYDKTSAEYEEELKQIADRYIYTFKELL